MSKKSGASISLRGVRQNNLKGFDLDLPVGRLIVVTGLSGSGKSSLAFDTLYAEGQRRYIETFSPYARQFFDRMDKPRVESIQGIPPAIALEQRNSVRTTRSTVGTMTEICDYMKALWPQIASLRCKGCGKAVRKDSPQTIWETVSAGEPDEGLVTFQIPLSEKLPLAESLSLVEKQGYQRILVEAGAPGFGPWQVWKVEEAGEWLEANKPHPLTIVQDRLKTSSENRSRWFEACEQAYHFGKGHLAVYWKTKASIARFSNKRHCADCNLEYRETSPALFSFNHPFGACPVCRGFGRTITIDYNIAIPDRSLTLQGGAIKPWQVGHGLESQQDMMKFCRKRKVPTDVPFRELPEEHRRWVVDGDPGYGKDAEHQWPAAWYGLKGYFRWLESKAYKMHVRVLLAKYRAYQTCPECKGKRFQPETLLYQIQTGQGAWITLSDFYQWPVSKALEFIQGFLKKERKASDPRWLCFKEVASRLAYLEEVGLGYLTLDRPTRSLSGGETERVNLTTCLGSHMVNTLFVLDEPSVGLHARDTERLVKILERLRDAGNTMVIVEHESSVMCAADQIVDLGPGHGEAGGDLVFQGTHAEILKSKASLTGQYLSGRKKVEQNRSRPVDLARDPLLRVRHATLHNLQDLNVDIPLGKLVCISGVSGSGKSTLVRDLLYPALLANLQTTEDEAQEEEGEEQSDEERESGATSDLELSGYDTLSAVVMIDQSVLGKTPRSNPAVYIGAFGDIRDLFASTDTAKAHGLNQSAFSFNSREGQCERCRGAGFEKIEMQFLSDIFIRCPDCGGRRYREHVLAAKIKPSPESTRAWSIADVLEATVDDALAFLKEFPKSRTRDRACASLELLQEVGLGYLRLGQPINTLSGGESQRLKLVRHLAEFSERRKANEKPSLYIFDEPTTGLHFDDVNVLLKAMQRIVDRGHSVLVVEHNLDVIRAADWIIDLGPEGGEAGGRVVAQGPPQAVADCPESHTGQALEGARLCRAKRDQSHRPN